VTSDGVFSIASMPQAASIPAPAGLSLEHLGHCVRRLDPGSRALLDLSVRRRLPDDAMAPILGTDPFHLAWRRARALERVANELGGDEPVSLSDVRAALGSLPDEIWSPLPQLMPPRQGPTLALVPRPDASVVPAEPGRLARFADGAPPLGASLKAVGSAVAGAVLRVVLWRRQHRPASGVTMLD
jgi:hypothetical protein